MVRKGAKRKSTDKPFFLVYLNIINVAHISSTNSDVFCFKHRWYGVSWKSDLSYNFSLKWSHVLIPTNVIGHI